MASVFSIYNLSGQMDAFKRAMDMDDVAEICAEFDVEPDDTLIVIFKRGGYSAALTAEKESATEIIHSRIKHNSVF